MAKMYDGYLGGFSGRLGPAVGYMWNGKWCLRSRPGRVANPRTAEQVAHRTMFREEVRLAARLRRAAEVGLTAMGREMGMTCFNLFVSINQQAFGLRDGELEVDYSRLTVGMGPVAPVEFGEVRTDEHNVLTVRYKGNPTKAVCTSYDRVMLYVYCPEAGEGCMSAPMYRYDRQLSYCLPDEYAGREVHVYGMVQDDEGRAADSCYLGSLTAGDAVVDNDNLLLDNLGVGDTEGGHGTEQVEACGECREVDAAGGGGGDATAREVEHG